MPPSALGTEFDELRNVCFRLTTKHSQPDLSNRSTKSEHDDTSSSGHRSGNVRNLIGFDRFTLRFGRGGERSRDDRFDL